MPASNAASVTFTSSRPFSSYATGYQHEDEERLDFNENAYDVANEKCARCIAMKAIQVHSDVYVHDVAILQWSATGLDWLNEG